MCVSTFRNLTCWKCPLNGVILCLHLNFLGYLALCSNCQRLYTIWRPHQSLSFYPIDIIPVPILAKIGLPLSFISNFFSATQLKLLESSKDCERLFGISKQLLCPLLRGHDSSYADSSIEIRGQKYFIFQNWQEVHRVKLVYWLLQMDVKYSSIINGIRGGEKTKQRKRKK